MDKVITLMTDQRSFIKVRASHIRALVMGDVGLGAWYKVYIDGLPEAFLITEVSAEEIGDVCFADTDK